MPCEKQARALIIPEGTDLEEFLRIGREEMLPAAAVADSAPWWLGDYVNFGEGKYGEKYSQALEATDYNYDQLVRYAHVCRKVPIENRDLCRNMSMGLAVARLDPAKQREYLLRAQSEGLTSDGLKKLLKEAEPSGSNRGRKPKQKLLFADWLEQYVYERDISLPQQVVDVMQDAWEAGQANK